MSEEKQTVVEEAVADAQPEQDISPEVQPQAEEAPQDTTQDRNWREVRQLLKETNQTVEELKNRNYALEEKERSRSQPPEIEEEPDLSDDDISTVGVTKKLIRKQSDKLDQLIQEMKQREASSVEDRLRSKYSDYDAVVNKENLQSLFTTAPELVKMLKANHENPYEQALGAYKLMKKFGMSGEEGEKFKENQTKPRSVNSVGQTSALSQANAFSRGLTPDLRKQLWSEMKEAAKRA